MWTSRIIQTLTVLQLIGYWLKVSFWYGTFNAILNTIMCTLFVFFFQVCCKMVAVTIFLWILQNQSSEQSSLEPNFQHGFPKVFFMSLWTKPIKIKTGEVSVGPTCGLYLSWSIPKGYWTLPTLIIIGLDINLSDWPSFSCTLYKLGQYRGSSPYANFITVNFITTIFQNFPAQDLNFEGD